MGGHVRARRLPSPRPRMHSVRVSSAGSHDRAFVSAGRPWLTRLVALCAFVSTWLAAGTAFAAESSVLHLVSSGAAPAMSPRGDEPVRARVDDAAPLCDMRCATTFAPAPQFQDTEVALATFDDDDDASTIDIARLVQGQSSELGASHDDPCNLAPPRVDPAPPEGALVQLPRVAGRPRPAAASSLERPPRT